MAHLRLVNLSLHTARQLIETMIVYFWLDTWEQVPAKFESQYNNTQWKCTLECRLQSVLHCASASVLSNYYGQPVGQQIDLYETT